MLIYVDIDHTICNTHGTDYSKSTPMMDRIEKINKLYDGGDTIVYWTARGSVTGIDHSELTKNNLKSGGKIPRIKIR